MDVRVREYKKGDVEKFLQVNKYNRAENSKFSNSYEENIKLLEWASFYQRGLSSDSEENKDAFKFLGLVDYFVDKKDFQDKETNELFLLIATIIYRQLYVEQPKGPYSGDTDEGAFGMNAYLSELKKKAKYHDWIFRKSEKEYVTIGWGIDSADGNWRYRIQMKERTSQKETFIELYQVKKTIVGLMREDYKLELKKNEKKTILIGACVQCNSGAMNFFCGNCHQVAYCGETCQRNHWNKHKYDC